MNFISGGQEFGQFNSADYHFCGIEQGTEILRYKDPDGSLSGVLFKFAGGVLTARHVVKAHEISGFTAGQAKDVDIAFKLDKSCNGLPLGYVDSFTIDRAEIVTSDIKEPDKLVTIPGRVGIYFLPTLLHPFDPHDPEAAVKYLKPGLSGSPLIYKNHIVGLIPWQNLNDKYEVAAVVFSGKQMKMDMEELGLSFENIG